MCCRLAIVFVFGLASMSFGQDFTKKKIRIGQVPLVVEIADSDELRQRGLMFRRGLRDDQGMLFVFDKEEVRSFWMKNTFVPLAIGFFNKERLLVDTQEMKPATSEMDLRPPSYQSRVPAQYALEVPKGWFNRKGLKSGVKLNFE